MTLSNVALIRLINQQISETNFKTIKDLVGWMGAMQAQDYAMMKWAIGTRLTGSTEQLVDKAMNDGEIIRTHLLRPTWHLTSSDDVYWMLELTASQIKAKMKSRNKELELSEAIFSKCNRLLEKVLVNGNHLKREELFSEFEKLKIATDNNRGSHLLLNAELDGIICSGISKGKSPTYAILTERISKPKPLIKDEALAKLAQKYFTSHGPATLQDFVWWSGLSVSDARHALEMVKTHFISEIIETETYWWANVNHKPASDKTYIYLLPAFDEYIISYRNRNASLSQVNNKKAVSDNGIFRPVIVINGRVEGIWKRSLMKDLILLETSFFLKQNNSMINLIEKEAKSFGRFFNREVKVKHSFQHE